MILRYTVFGSKILDSKGIIISIVFEIFASSGFFFFFFKFILFLSENDISLLLKVDLDLGNYERFLDLKLTRDNNITTGKIYQASI